MKNLFIILFCFMYTSGIAATYYVSNTGNDSNDGLTTLTAWATIAKVNAQTFSPGDSILFERGGLWREQLNPDSGNSSGYIYYSAYGSGVLPKFYGSTNESEESDWTDLGGNLWSNTDATFDKDVGNIIFNGNSCGVKKQSSGEVTSQGDFWYSFTGDSILIYSTSNPAVFYSDIECALYHSIGLINMIGKQYVDIGYFDIRYAGGESVAMYSGCSNIRVHNCEIRYGGGADMLGNYAVRFGNGIDTWADASDIYIYDNYVSNMYDAGISPQYTDASTPRTINNIQMYRNVIDSCEYSYEFFNRPASSVSDSVMFYNNTCLDAGYGWSHGQRWDADQGHHLRLANHTATATNCTMKNNIFSGSINYALSFSKGFDTTKVDIDYNIYNVGTNVAEIVDFPETETWSSLAAYQAATGLDENSITGDPLLNSDYTLQSGSPAINVGIDVGLDYYGTAPDLGAFEYISTPTGVTRLLRNTNTGKIINLQ